MRRVQVLLVGLQSSMVAIIDATHYGYRTTMHTFRHCNTHTFIQNTAMRNWSWEMIMGFEALYADRGRRNPVRSGKEAHWSLRGLIVKSTEHCGADCKPLDRYAYLLFFVIRTTSLNTNTWQTSFFLEKDPLVRCTRVSCPLFTNLRSLVVMYIL